MVDTSILTELKLKCIDVVIILDSYYFYNAIRASASTEQIIELLAVISTNQQAFKNSSTSVRIWNQTFTTRLAKEVAIRRGRAKKALILLDIIASLQSQKNVEQLSLFETVVGSKAIPISLKLRNTNKPESS